MNTTTSTTTKKEPDYKDERVVANMFPIGCRVDDSAGVTATVMGYIQAPPRAPDAGEWRLELQYLPPDGPTPGVKARTCKRTERKAGTSDSDDEKDKDKKKAKVAAE